MTEPRVQMQGWDEAGHALLVFDGVEWVRGVWKCECGRIQADYRLPGSENILTCHACECGAQEPSFSILELIGRGDDGKGPERDYKYLIKQDWYYADDAPWRTSCA